jgi:hypothetical protein
VGPVGSVARTGEQCGQRVATHQLSRFVTLRAPRSPRPSREHLSHVVCGPIRTRHDGGVVKGAVQRGGDAMARGVGSVLPDSHCTDCRRWSALIRVAIACYASISYSVCVCCVLACLHACIMCVCVCVCVRVVNTPTSPHPCQAEGGKDCSHHRALWLPFWLVLFAFSALFLTYTPLARSGTQKSAGNGGWCVCAFSFFVSDVYVTACSCRDAHLPSGEVEGLL